MKIKSLLFPLVWCQQEQYTNDFVIEIDGPPQRVYQIAEENHFDVKGEIFPGHWHLRSQRIKRRSTGDEAVHRNLLDLPEVKWFQQQKIKKRTKRDFIYNYEEFNDPLFDQMWYLNPAYVNQDTNKLRNQPNDDIRHMNITGAWSQGFSGKGIVVTILDDGLELTHPDLKGNYDPKASYDINNEDDDPTPRYNPLNRNFDYNNAKFRPGSSNIAKLSENILDYKNEENMHGTRCAGQVAATASNGVCVPGIAFNAKIGGIRMLDGDVTDLVEAKSIGFNPQHVDVYSASWGPDDDGRTVDGPAELAMKAFRYGAEKGRNGKGSIFVWASGNGGRYEDNCNCDGYTTSIYTISVSSTTMDESIPWYSEACSSTMTTTYSSGAWNQAKVITTDLRGMCTAKHTGTSASAPIAAAIVALALEANPNLTWRDMQHIIIQTSKRRKLKASDWQVNGVGREYSHRYGYGLMDAGAMVDLAKNWEPVPIQRICAKSIIARSNHFSYRSIQPTHTEKSPLHIDFYVTKKDCGIVNKITRMEHVIVQLNIQFTRRGDLKMVLISPAGTESIIMDKRRHDSSSRGYSSHDLLTVHMWDENPYGVWRLKIINLCSLSRRQSMGVIRRFDIIIRGTSDGDISSLPTSDVKLTSDEEKNGLWPGVHRGWRLPRPRYTYRDMNGHTYQHKQRPSYKKGSTSPNFGSNVYKYLSQISDRFHVPNFIKNR